MKLAFPLSSLSTVSSSSTLGPQFREVQYAGVAMTNAVGLPDATAWCSVIWCMSHGGLRVQIGLTPRGLSTVGVSLGMALSAGSNVSALERSFTSTRVVAIWRGADVVSTTRVQTPALSKVTWRPLRPLLTVGPGSGVA